MAFSIGHGLAPVRPYYFLKGLTFDVFHRNEGLVIGFIDGKNRGDVRVIE